MDALRAFIAAWLDPIGVVLSLLALVPIVWTWWDVVFGRRRRERRWFEDIRRHPGERPAILIVDLLAGKDVRASVENFRRRDSALAAIPDERICVVRRDRTITAQTCPTCSASCAMLPPSCSRRVLTASIISMLDRRRLRLWWAPNLPMAHACCSISTGTAATSISARSGRQCQPHKQCAAAPDASPIVLANDP